MKNIHLLGALCGLILVGGEALGTSNFTANVQSTNAAGTNAVRWTSVLPEGEALGASNFTANVQSTNAASTNVARWTSYYISTNEYAEYLHEDFSYTSDVDLKPELNEKIQQFFLKNYRNTYDVLKLSTQDEDEIYDIINDTYHRRELFNSFREYMDMLTELERLGSSIKIHEIDFKKITVKGFEDNILTVEAIWTVHGTLHHTTHDHIQKNANCVQFKVEVSPDNELKVKRVNVISIDRFNLYQ
jgi:hypothetical protein